MLYVLVTLKNGEQYVSQFGKLKGIGSYGNKVMSGKAALNLWRTLGDKHPVSGEAMRVRQRKMVNGLEVASMEEVMPREDASAADVADLKPEAFEARPHIEDGPHGKYLFDEKDETRPEGVSTRIPYPVYRDPETLRKYVILDATIDPVRKHFLDAESHGASPVNPDGDDHESPEDFESFDDDEPF